jgi:hypothetical protein
MILRLAFMAPALLLQNFDANVAQLDWLAGHWRTEAPAQGAAGEWTEEIWTRPEAESLLGISRTVRGGRTTGFEFMRMANDDRGAALYASPSGRPPVRFEMTWASHQTVTFTNRDHDFPQRIVYQRSGNQLRATVSLADGSRAQTWTFRLQPAR